MVCLLSLCATSTIIYPQLLVYCQQYSPIWWVTLQYANTHACILITPDTHTDIVALVLAPADDDTDPSVAGGGVPGVQLSASHPGDDSGGPLGLDTGHHCHCLWSPRWLHLPTSQIFHTEKLTIRGGEIQVCHENCVGITVGHHIWSSNVNVTTSYCNHRFMK